MDILHPQSYFLYLALMRYEYLLIAALLLTGCGRRTMNVNLAKDLIVQTPQEGLKKEDLDVAKVSQIGGSEAIAETRLKVAFRFEKVGTEWVVREVRIGHGQWEKVANLLQALERVKIEETQESLNLIAEAILKYRQSNGNLPVFKDYVSLSDLLSPMYLTPLIRLDAWRRPLAAERPNANTILLRSAGPDGKFGTSDDICRTISP